MRKKPTHYWCVGKREGQWPQCGECPFKSEQRLSRVPPRRCSEQGSTTSSALPAPRLEANFQQQAAAVPAAPWRFSVPVPRPCLPRPGWVARWFSGDSASDNLIVLLDHLDWGLKSYRGPEAGFHVLAAVITAGQRGDAPAFEQVTDRIRVPRISGGHPRTRPGHVLADRAYSSRQIRSYLRKRGIAHTIPEKRVQAGHRLRRSSAGGRPPGFDREMYKRRHKVECRIAF